MKSPVKVLHVLKYFRPTFTGAGIFLERMSAIFDVLVPGVEHDLLVTNTVSPADATPASSTLRRIVYLSPRPTSNAVRELRLLWWLLRNMWQYRVIHLHTHVDRYFLSYLLARLARRRLIITATLDDSIPNLVSSYRPRYRALVTRLFQVFDAYIAISPKLYAETERVVAPGKTHLIPISILPPSVPVGERDRTRESYGIGLADVAMIFVGGICARKDPLFLVQQLPAVLEFCANARLLIVGPVLEQDHYGAMLATIAKHGLEQHVIFTGQVGDPFPLFAMSDIMVFASHLEGFGAVVIEGMAQRLPPVVRHLPGVNDFFVREGETGFLFTNATEYLQAIRRLTGDTQLRSRIGMAAEVFVKREFDSIAVARRFLDLYGVLPKGQADAAGEVQSEPTDAQRLVASLPANASVIDRRFHIPVDIPANSRPVLVTTVDAEETFDWSGPFSADAHNVSSLAHQKLCHRIFERYGIIPTYLVTYPVVTQEAGFRPLQEYLQDGRCEIGTQLHPWVTPPFAERVNLSNSFPGNLPLTLEYEKLRNLTEAITRRFGIAPRVYRAGRYGVGRRTADLLKSLNYSVDTSVMPHFTFEHEGGPSFIGYSSAPFWTDAERSLLEIPISSAFVGALSPPARPLETVVLSTGFGHSAMRGLLARSRLLERIKLTPEGTTLDEAKRLTRNLLNGGTKIFVLTYHSPSLVPGSTPYVRSESDLARFLAWLDDYYHFFFGEVGGEPVTATSVHRVLKANER